MSLSVVADFAIVVVGAASVGGVELVALHRDEPLRALSTRPALFYMAVNGAVGAAALALMRAIGITFGEPERLWRDLIAVFSAVGFLRSSLFLRSAGGETLQAGPASALQTLLSVAADHVDDARSEAKRKRVSALVDGLDYQADKGSLIAICKAMAREDRERRASLDLRVEQIESDTGLSDATRIFLLGVALVAFTGPRTFKSAVEQVQRGSTKSR